MAHFIDKTLVLIQFDQLFIIPDCASQSAIGRANDTQRHTDASLTHFTCLAKEKRCPDPKKR